MDRVTCSGCSLLCDDVMVRSDGIFIDEVIGACLKGKEHYDQVSSANRMTSPHVRSNGGLVKISWEEAMNKTLEIIRKSKKPLLYGFSNLSCEAQMKAIELAKEIDGFIDSNATICHGKVLEKAKHTGITLTTLTEIINKADLLISWGANAAESIPRLLNKVLFSRGKFRMTGREIKTIIIIDPAKTASFGVMGVRDVALRIEPNGDLDLIRVLKEECCTTDSIPKEGVAGIDSDDLKRLLLHLTGAENAVIIAGQGVLGSNNDISVLQELLELMELINQKQERGRISLITLGGHYNMMGFDHVALSIYGKNGALQFKNNQLVDTEDTIVSKIEKDDFDCVIIAGTDPISHFPHSLSKKLANKLIIIIDNRKNTTSLFAEVQLPTAITGIEADGLAYRLDHVPVQLNKLINPPSNVPTDLSLIDQIIKLIGQGGNK